MNINPTLIFIIGEIFIAALLLGMAWYVGTHMEKPSRRSSAVSHSIKK